MDWLHIHAHSVLFLPFPLQFFFQPCGNLHILAQADLNMKETFTNFLLTPLPYYLLKHYDCSLVSISITKRKHKSHSWNELIWNTLLIWNQNCVFISKSNRLWHLYIGIAEAWKPWYNHGSCWQQSWSPGKTRSIFPSEQDNPSHPFFHSDNYCSVTNTYLLYTWRMQLSMLKRMACSLSKRLLKQQII